MTLQYPSIVQIETAGSCNASCSFCPHSTMNRTSQERMPADLFHKLIDELATWPTPPAHLCPFLTNEPFMDSRIYDWCRAINTKLPNTQLYFFTNGSLFTDATLSKLSTISNIALIHVSLHHSNATDYEHDLHLPWPRTLESIHRLLSRNKWNVRLGRVQSGDPAADQSFLDFCATEFPGTPACLSYRYNWKGDIASTFSHQSTLDIICPRHGSLTILCDGRVALCCMDERGEYSLGDAKTDTLASIYNNATAIRYRTTTKRHNTPCNQCNMHG